MPTSRLTQADPATPAPAGNAERADNGHVREGARVRFRRGVRRRRLLGAAEAFGVVWSVGESRAVVEWYDRGSGALLCCGEHAVSDLERDYSQG